MFQCPSNKQRSTPALHDHRHLVEESTQGSPLTIMDAMHILQLYWTNHWTTGPYIPWSLGMAVFTPTETGGHRQTWTPAVCIHTVVYMLHRALAHVEESGTCVRVMRFQYHPVKLGQRQARRDQRRSLICLLDHRLADRTSLSGWGAEFLGH